LQSGPGWERIECNSIAFDQRLREPGYIEGQNLIADFLNPEDQAEGIAAAIKEAGFGGKSMSLCPTSDIGGRPP